MTMNCLCSDGRVFSRRWLHVVPVLSLLVVVTACPSIGPPAVPRDRTEYLSAVAESWKEQMLQNVVRIRYGDAPSFLDVSSIIASYALQGTLSVGVAVNSPGNSAFPANSSTFGGGVAYQDRPTISYTPLAGDKFTKSLLRPIPPSGIFQLIQAGYPADFVLLVTVRSMNGVRNQVASGGQTEPADPEFYPLLDAFRRLQLSSAVSLRAEKRGQEDVGIMVLSGRRIPEVNQALKYVLDTLHLKPGKDGQLTIAFGAVQRSSDELAVLSRSISEILIELAFGVEVPSAHIAERRTMPSLRVASAENPRDRPLVRISSGPNAPSNAFAAVRYRNTSYWIDDGDFLSKRVFTFLMLFSSLAETGVMPQVPSLTLPVQ